MERKSWWQSKENWTQVVSFLGMIATFFGFDLPMEVQLQIVAGILAVSNVVTFILRTWYTKSAIASSS